MTPPSQYLIDYCLPVSDVASRQRTFVTPVDNSLVVPRHRRSTHGRQAFAVAGLDGLELSPGQSPGSKIVTTNNYKRLLKTLSSVLQIYILLTYFHFPSGVVLVDSER